jgi:hypothetical protein
MTLALRLRLKLGLGQYVYAFRTGSKRMLPRPQIRGPQALGNYVSFLHPESLMCFASLFHDGRLLPMVREIIQFAAQEQIYGFCRLDLHRTQRFSPYIPPLPGHVYNCFRPRRQRTPPHGLPLPPTLRQVNHGCRFGLLPCDL